MKTYSKKRATALLKEANNANRKLMVELEKEVKNKDPKESFSLKDMFAAFCQAIHNTNYWEGASVEDIMTYGVARKTFAQFIERQFETIIDYDNDI